MKLFSAKSRAASHLRGRKYDLVRRFNLPEDLVGGSLSWSKRKCGRQNCRCTGGEGHPNLVWSNSFLGKRKVHRIPKEWAEDFETMMQSGQEMIAAIEEVMHINAKLFAYDLEARRERAQKSTCQAAKKKPSFKKRSTFRPRLRS